MLDRKKRSIAVIGSGHLAETTFCAARERGWSPEAFLDALLIQPPSSSEPAFDIVFFAEDVLDHDDVPALQSAFATAVAAAYGHLAPLVLLSQVPPGTIRAWVDAFPDGMRDDIFYMVDTIIVESAVARMVRPEQIVVGCYDPQEYLPLILQEYLVGLQCPVMKMSYESAELAKCMINVALARQVAFANDGYGIALAVEADWDAVVAVLRNDARIGQRAYLQPGAINQHLMRDVETIAKLSANQTKMRGSHHG